MTDAQPPKEASAKAVRVLGGPVSAARILLGDGSKYQTLQSWLANRVPAEHCPAIERATRRVAAEKGNDALIVLCEELRPDIPWGVLREQAATAPADQKAAA